MSKVFSAGVSSYTDKKLAEFINIFFESIKEKLVNAEKILLKPNLLQACAPEKAVTTHPDFLREIVISLKKNTKAELLIGDSPGANFGKYEIVLEKTGLQKIIDEFSLKVIRIETTGKVNFDGFVYSSIVNEVDLVINLPKLKTHQLTGLTLAVKNLFGLIPGNVKTAFHRNNPEDGKLAQAIYKYFTEIEKNTIHILDGILSHEGDGPSGGSPISTGLVCASVDAVALDITAAKYAGFKPEFCLTTRAALKAGYDISVVENEEVFPAPYFKLKKPIAKSIPYIPPFLKKFAAGLVYAKPLILNEKCIKCMLCFKSCPVDAVKVEDKMLRVEKKECIECFCCHEVCESEAIIMERSFLHRMYVK